MKRHAEQKHPKEWKAAQAHTQTQAISSFFSPKSMTTKVEKYTVKSEKRKKLNRKLVRMIAMDMRPINIVTGTGFKEFVQELDPRYVLPTRKTISEKLLPSAYEQAMNDLQGELDKVQDISLTTDGWTSLATDKYQAFTVHFIDWSAKEPQLQSKILECSPFDKRSTAVEIEKELRRISDAYKIGSKLKLTVSDNAADVRLALSKFGVPSIGCGAHKLNLAANSGIEKCQRVKDLRAKLAQIVRTTKISPNAKKALKKCLDRVGFSGTISKFKLRLEKPMKFES